MGRSTNGCLIFIGIVLIVIIAIYWIRTDLLSFFIVLIFGIIVYLFSVNNRIKQRKIELEQKKIELEEFNRKKSKLISTNDYKYIRGFVVRYKSVNYDNDEFNKLKDLISEKGMVFSDKELDQLITEEANKQNYEEFKTRILNNKPNTLEDYNRNLIEIYGEDYLKYLNLFKDLLIENKIHFDQEQITEKIKKTKKDIELKYFKKKLESENFSSITIQNIDLITVYKFERFLKTLFEKMGYKVEHTKLSGDQGADLIITKFGEKIVVQAKRYSNKVNNKAIQEIVAAIKHYNAERGIVITNSEFTRSAIELANSNDIELMDRSKLEKLIHTYF